MCLRLSTLCRCCSHQGLHHWDSEDPFSRQSPGRRCTLLQKVFAKRKSRTFIRVPKKPVHRWNTSMEIAPWPLDRINMQLLGFSSCTVWSDIGSHRCRLMFRESSRLPSLKVPFPYYAHYSIKFSPKLSTFVDFLIFLSQLMSRVKLFIQRLMADKSAQNKAHSGKTNEHVE